MQINDKQAQQLQQLKLYFEKGLAVYSTVLCGENVEIKSSISSFVSSLSSISDIKIGSYSLLNSGDYRHVCIGNYCTFAEGCKVLAKRDYSFLNSAMCRINNFATPTKIFDTFDQRQPVISSETTWIGHDVRVGSKVKINNGVIIGHGAVLEDGVVLKQHVPPYAVVAGNPARIVRMRFTSEQIQSLLDSKWFLYDWQGLELDWDDTELCLAQMLQHLALGQVGKLGSGFNLKIQGAKGLALLPCTWTLEQDLSAKFGTSDMQQIFAMPHIKAVALTL